MPIAHGPAEHLPHGHPGRLTEDVPEANINRREAAELGPLPDRVRDHFVQPAPVEFDGERVVPEEHRRGELVNETGDRVRHVARVRAAREVRVRVGRDEQDRRVVGQVDRFEGGDLHVVSG